MGIWTRIAIAFAASLAAGAAIQQSLMAARQLPDPLSALPFVAAIVAVISITFAIACRRGVRLTAINRVAAWLVGIMLFVGLGSLIVGLVNLSPGIAGDIVFGLAAVLDLYFLLPSAVAIPIHWRLLRGAVQAA